MSGEVQKSWFNGIKPLVKQKKTYNNIPINVEEKKQVMVSASCFQEIPLQSKEP